MQTSSSERRRRKRSREAQANELRISTRDRLGRPVQIGAKLADIGDGGMGVDTLLPLETGALVTVVGEVVRDEARLALHHQARVAYCLYQENGHYRSGLCFDQPFDGFSQQRDRARAGAAREDFVDYYEVLQLSPNADLETIHRVYRLLAQRYHPDNQETGDAERFKMLVNAYRTLSDPEQRAAYDVRYQSALGRRWKIFDHPEAAQGVEAERRKRQGILALLHTKRIYEPDQPALTILEIEDLLGCPREHLECALWFLREMGWIARSDNGRYSITVKGFLEAEAAAGVCQREDRLLTTSGSGAGVSPHREYAGVR
jgi:hypothetical protein